MSKQKKKEDNLTTEKKLVPVSFKFPPEVKDLLEKVSKATRRSNTGTLETLIREAAKKEGIS